MITWVDDPSQSWKSLRLLALTSVLFIVLVGCRDSIPNVKPAGDENELTASSGPSESSTTAKVGDAGRTTGQSRRRDAAVVTPAVQLCEFQEVAAELGLQFVYDNGASARMLMVEATGGGGGWLDFDRDEYWDLYLVQGGSPLSSGTAGNSSDQLFRNRRGQGFTAVTEAAGISELFYGHGLSVGDYDGDGFDDVYVTNVGRDTLLRNQGDGTFQDVTLDSITPNLRWSSSAAWADLDQDGDLDLFVCNYVNYDPNAPIPCFGDDGKPGICHPRDVDPARNCFYLNQGDGTFRECLVECGLDGEGSKSLGVVIADFNGDYLSDIYVANDTTANHLFVNHGNLSFHEDALAAGCAASGMGQFQASMGIGFGDYDNDGQFDLYLTHFTSDSNTLYRGLPGGTFDDTTRITGIHKPTMDMLAFGTVMLDFNSDGAMDLLIANGHVDHSFQSQGDEFDMPLQLFSFDTQQWRDVSQTAGSYFQQKQIARALAVADFDNDGAADVVVVNQNKPVALLHNQVTHRSWLKVRAVGQDNNRRGIGLEVVVLQGDRRWRQQIAGGTSYCASNQPALFFGLGDSSADCSLQVRWPSGRQQTLSDIRVNQEILLLERDAR